MSGLTALEGLAYMRPVRKTMCRVRGRAVRSYQVPSDSVVWGILPQFSGSFGPGGIRKAAVALARLPPRKPLPATRRGAGLSHWDARGKQGLYIEKRIHMYLYVRMYLIIRICIYMYAFSIHTHVWRVFPMYEDCPEIATMIRAPK